MACGQHLLAYALGRRLEAHACGLVKLLRVAIALVVGQADSFQAQTQQAQTQQAQTQQAQSQQAQTQQQEVRAGKGQQDNGNAGNN